MKFINIILLSILVASTISYHKRRAHKLKGSQTPHNMIFDFPQPETTKIEVAPHVNSFGDIIDTPNKTLSDDFNKTKEEHKGVYPNYPPNNGAMEGTRKKAVIEVGKTLFRYGRLNGAYFTDQCEDEVDLSLPFKDYYNNLHCFKVVKPFTAEYGKIAPWFRSKGGPNQYMTQMTQGNDTKKGMNVCQLLLNEYIVYDENCKCPETTPAQAIINKRIIRSANEFKSMKNKTNDYDECAELDTIINMENKRKKGKNSLKKASKKSVISAASKRFFH